LKKRKISCPCWESYQFLGHYPDYTNQAHNEGCYKFIFRTCCNLQSLRSVCDWRSLTRHNTDQLRGLIGK
jgi:hypothetical protein